MSIEEENEKAQVAPAMGGNFSSFFAAPGGGASPLSMLSGLFGAPGGAGSFPFDQFGGGFGEGDGFVTAEASKAANALFKQFNQTARLINNTEKDLKTFEQNYHKLTQS